MRLTRKQAKELGIDLEALPAPKVPPVRLPGEPDVSVENPRPGAWVATVIGWRPATKNDKTRSLRKWIVSKKRDAAVMERVARQVPTADGFRAVRCAIKMPGNLIDPVNAVESFADALVNAGLLLDDSADKARIETPTVARGKALVTVIEIIDADTPAGASPTQGPRPHRTGPAGA